VIAVLLGDPIPLSGEVQRAGIIRIAIDLIAGEGRRGQAEEAEDDDLRRRGHKMRAPLSLYTILMSKGIGITRVGTHGGKKLQGLASRISCRC
jgi:hypothetical protein